MVARNIGLKVNPPEQECQDSNCPFHGTLPVRGRIMKGIVASTKMKGTVTVRRDYLRYIKKYRRYSRNHSMTAAHHPPCIPCEVGDTVRIAECRPLSKTVSYVVVECLKEKEEES
ncbi:MAG: 30S ribosomal protein S17 [Candidatus Hermodarchaeia archaeon]|jgi:small subunit ribosomal protein S17